MQNCKSDGNVWLKVIGEEEFKITTDPTCLDVDVIYRFLAEESYWARGIPRPILENSIEGSLCFGLLRGAEQIGFARVISDFGTIAYLGDVFVLPAFRGRGLSNWLLECVFKHRELQNVRRWILFTRDAHGLYEKCGFTPLDHPEGFMEKHKRIPRGVDHTDS
jgi:GNAT superfamily N-acetyltransferase